MQPVDTLICAAHVVPVEPRGVLRDHAVAIRGGRIEAIMPTAEALARFDAREVVRLDRHALIPGLVNLHCHAAMALMRGFADDVPLMSWLMKKFQEDPPGSLVTMSCAPWSARAKMALLPEAPHAGKACRRRWPPS